MSRDKEMALKLLDGIFQMLLAANRQSGSIFDAWHASRRAIVEMSDSDDEKT